MPHIFPLPSNLESPWFQELGCGCFAGMLPHIVHGNHLWSFSRSDSVLGASLPYYKRQVLASPDVWLGKSNGTHHFMAVLDAQSLGVSRSGAPSLLSQQHTRNCHSSGIYFHCRWNGLAPEPQEESILCFFHVCHKLHLISFPTSDISNTIGSPRLYCTSSSTVFTIARIFFRPFPNPGLF